MIELPLCAVRMIRIGSLPRRNAQNLDIKGMPLVEVGGLGLASQRLRDLFPRTAELSLRCGPCELCHLCCIDLVHKRSRLTRYGWNVSVIFYGIIQSNPLARLKKIR